MFVPFCVDMCSFSPLLGVNALFLDVNSRQKRSKYALHTKMSNILVLFATADSVHLLHCNVRGHLEFNRGIAIVSRFA